MYQNSIQLMQSMREAGIEHRSDTPLDDENLIDTIRVGWSGASLPATVILFRVNDRGAHLEVEELIPEAHLGEHSNVGTLGVIAGFVLMMVLDVALG